MEPVRIRHTKKFILAYWVENTRIGVGVIFVENTLTKNMQDSKKNFLIAVLINVKFPSDIRFAEDNIKEAIENRLIVKFI